MIEIKRGPILMNMETNFLCPKCKSFLNIGTKVVFSVHIDENQKGLMLFDKTLGNYNVKTHDFIEFENGSLTGIYCPICHENLVSEKNSNLAKVIMVDENNDEFEILFSRIIGEQATYKIKSNKIEAFGTDKNKYLDSIKTKK